MSKLLAVAALLAAPLALASQPEPLLAQLERLTAYDARAPLEPTEVSREARPDVTTITLTYRGAEGPVPAYLVRPEPHRRPMGGPGVIRQGTYPWDTWGHPRGGQCAWSRRASS
jgi:hypothetical protein